MNTAISTWGLIDGQILSADKVVEMSELGIPIYDSEVDYSAAWGFLLSAASTEELFPIEASYANHYFQWPHVIGNQFRLYFDCTDPQSFVLIPPEDYLEAYWIAKIKRII